MANRAELAKPVGFMVRWNRQPQYDEVRYFEKERDAANFKEELLKNGWSDPEFVPLYAKAAALSAGEGGALSAELIRAQERERCAKIAEDTDLECALPPDRNHDWQCGVSDASIAISDNIRNSANLARVNLQPRKDGEAASRSPLENRVRNLVYNVEQRPDGHAVREIIASLRDALGLKEGERP